MIPRHEAAILSRMAEDARSVANDMRDVGQRLYMLQIAARGQVRNLFPLP